MSSCQEGIVRWGEKGEGIKQTKQNSQTQATVWRLPEGKRDKGRG